jgi:sugar (pentulose or hexulose) kinase
MAAPTGDREAVIGVDIGTSSVRAAVFDLAGRRLGHAAHATKEWNEREHWHEQSSDDVWSAAGRLPARLPARLHAHATRPQALRFSRACAQGLPFAMRWLLRASTQVCVCVCVCV